MRSGEGASITQQAGPRERPAAEPFAWAADAATLEFSFVGGGVERLLGYPLERWTREPGFWADHLDPRDRERVLFLCRTAVDGGVDRCFDCRMIASDGRIVWLRNALRPGAGGATVRGSMLDVTSEHAAPA